MFNQRTIAVIKKELKEKLFSKAFIFMTVLIPIFYVRHSWFPDLYTFDRR